MARRSRRGQEETQIVNVIYQDGSLSSNRRVASGEIDEFARDDSIKAIIEAQDRYIAERSGNPRPPVKSIVPVSKKQL